MGSESTQDTAEMIGRLTIDQIVNCVAEVISVPVERIFRKPRDAKASTAQIIAMYLAIRCTSKSLPELCSIFGYASPGSFICRVKRAELLLKADEDLRSGFNSIVAKLKLAR